MKPYAMIENAGSPDQVANRCPWRNKGDVAGHRLPFKNTPSPSVKSQTKKMAATTANQGGETTVEILRESREGSNPLNRSCVNMANGVPTPDFCV